MRRLFQSLTTATAGAVAAALLASPASALTTTVIKPGSLPRGADVAIPHVRGHQIIDGAVQVTVKAPVVVLLGKSGPSYVVATGDDQGGHGRIFRVEADGTKTLITKAGVYSTQLSDDGARVVASRVPSGQKNTIITSWSVSTGEVLGRHAFRGYSTVLDAKDDQVLVGNDRSTRLWTSTTDSVAVVSRQGGYAGDLAAGLMATFTKDPDRGGCSVVRTIASGAPLWRSCQDRVDAFSTDGTRLATIPLLTDGIGPTVVTARKLTGRPVGRYVVKRGWFGELTFESPTALLLETNGPAKAATVRCVASACERASSLRSTPTPRAAGTERPASRVDEQSRTT